MAGSSCHRSTQNDYSHDLDLPCHKLVASSLKTALWRVFFKLGLISKLSGIISVSVITACYFRKERINDHVLDQMAFYCRTEHCHSIITSVPILCSPSKEPSCVQASRKSREYLPGKYSICATSFKREVKTVSLLCQYQERWDTRQHKGVSSYWTQHTLFLKNKIFHHSK